MACHRVAARIHTLQPGVLINDRLPTQGDYDTPEQFVPAGHTGAAVGDVPHDEQELGLPDPSDPDYKSARSFVHTLCEVRSRGGNLLLNSCAARRATSRYRPNSSTA